MYTCQCEGFQMGQSNDVLLKEVAVFWKVFNRRFTVFVNITKQSSNNCCIQVLVFMGSHFY